MTRVPYDPHAIIQIDRPGFTDGQSNVIWDSWESKRLFKSVTVDLVTNESSQVQWAFFDPKFRVIDSFSGTSAVPQSTVKIYLGYGGDLGEPVFKGLLAQVDREAEATVFTAYDMGFKMKLIKKAGYKNKKDDIAILRELATRNGLQFEGPDKALTLEPHNSMMQDEQTDWEHAMERAQDAGLVLYVRHDTLFAKYPAKVGTPALKLKHRKDFQMMAGWNFTFRTPESQDGRPRQVKVRGRTKGGKRVEGESDAATRGRERIVLKKDTPGVPTKSKLSKRAQAQKELEREHAFDARIEALFPTTGKRLDVRDTVEITKVGKLFSGKYICDTVRYEYAPGRMAMGLELYRDIGQ